MNTPRTIAVVTGSRADFGLLRPVMEAIDAHPDLSLRVLVTGTHLLPPDRTLAEVEASFTVQHVLEMQKAGTSGRFADAAALGRGVSGFAATFEQDRPDVVLVLGDRIEAFAAAATASVAGIRVAHMHGGDRAEGIADEALRHAITKLGHIHLAATARSVERVIAMGEDPVRTHLVGSPAIDGLSAIGPLADDAFDALGRPEILFLLHPTGADETTEHLRAERVLAHCRRAGRLLALDPNHDPGREGICRALDEVPGISRRTHLDRRTFIGLLRRVKTIIGNSSAGLIECAAIPVRCVNIGSRQAGREASANVIHCLNWDDQSIARAIERGLREPVLPFRHPYGPGNAGRRTAEVLATFDSDNHALQKRNTY